MKGGRNQEGYADPTATIAVSRVAREEHEQAECEAADKRAYDLIKVLKYIIKGAGFELTERVQVKDTKTGEGLQMIGIIKRIIRIMCILSNILVIGFAVYIVFLHFWKQILIITGFIIVIIIIAWAFEDM